MKYFIWYPEKCRPRWRRSAKLTGQWMNAIQSSAKCLMEYVANACATAQLCRLNIPGSALDGGAIGAGKFRDYLQQCLALVGDILAVWIQQRLELWDHNVHSCLRKTNGKLTVKISDRRCWWSSWITLRSGRQSRMWCISNRFNVFAKYGVPFRVANVGYLRWR